MRRLPWLLPLPLALAACTPDYPLDKPGTWSLERMGESNDANLRAMVANPHDLVEGAGSATDLGAEAGPPVTRLLTGNRKAIPQENGSVIALPTESSGPTGTGAGSGGSSLQ